MHPNTSGRDHRSAFPRYTRWSVSSRSTSLENPFRRGVLIVALTAALTAAGCDTPTEPPPPAAPGPTTPGTPPELNLHDCDDLMVGDRSSNCVTALQLLLNTRGAQLPPVGLFDEHTLDRVLQFQRSRGLPNTGTVGDLTKKALYKYPPKDEEWNLRTECVDLYGGAKGQCVQSLQRLLIQYGEQVLDNGKYGPETAEAVRRFQRNHNLPESGVTDSRTKEELYGQLSSVAPPDWRAEVDDCPGPNCRVYLDHATVTSIAGSVDTGTIARGFLGLIGTYVVHFACAALFKAPGAQVLCAEFVEWTTEFVTGLVRKAWADQKCIEISFQTTPEGPRPAGLNQTERCSA